MARKKFPIGIQTFEKIINGGFTYVDKTALIYKLVNEGTVYFLSRPRRFGKSLLISTLDAYFRGQKELFKGLAIEKLEEKWEEYPILRLDFSAKNYQNEKSLLLHLNDYLERWEAIYGTEKQDREIDERFQYILYKAFQKTGKPVVVLVDEYDKPLLHAITNEPLAAQFREILKGFYGVLKSCDQYLKFVFLTGVTKFSKVSIFSDLNQLQDISMMGAYDALCGISEDELEAYFQEDIQLLAENNGTTYNEMLEMLRLRYDGYHFSDNMMGVYNPFSILNVLYSLKIRDFWFQSGTPTFLMELLQQSHYDITDLEGVRMDGNDISNYSAEANNPIPIFYQAGYLTIKDYTEFEEYVLGYPNLEVRRGFLKFIAPTYVPPISKSGFDIPAFVTDLRNNDIDGFMTRLKAFIAAMNYELFDKELKERYFQTIFYLIFRLAGSYIQVEQHTSRGRIDAVVETKTHVYLFEFKLDKSVEEALAQIEARGYADRYLADKRQIVKIGAKFNSTTHQLDEWKVE